MPDRATIPALRLTESYFEAELERLLEDAPQASEELGTARSQRGPAHPRLVAGEGGEPSRTSHGGER